MKCHTGAADVQAKAVQLRSLASNVLAGPLNGDKLAAEYLLLQLISRFVFGHMCNCAEGAPARQCSLQSDRRLCTECKVVLSCLSFDCMCCATA